MRRPVAATGRSGGFSLRRPPMAPTMGTGRTTARWAAAHSMGSRWAERSCRRAASPHARAPTARPTRAAGCGRGRRARRASARAA
eukprot:5982189-Prymnesium_polylepis.1